MKRWCSIGIGYDLRGQKFGRLLVIKRVGYDKSRAILWLCKCDCGKNKTVPTSRLKKKKSGTKSCGCLKLEVTRKHQQQMTDLKRIFPPEAYKLSKGKRNAKYLTNSYIRRHIHNKAEIPTKLITPEMINLKRKLMIFKRLEKEIRNGINRTRD